MKFHYPSHFLALSFFLLLFSSCKKEEDFQQIKQEKSLAQNISYAKLLNEINSKELIPFSVSSSQRNISREQTNAEYEIDTSRIIEIERVPGIKYYSMLLKKKNESQGTNFYNLFIKKDSDNSITQTIIEFFPSAKSLLSGFKIFEANYSIIRYSTNAAMKNISKGSKAIDNYASGPGGCVEVSIEIPCEYGFVHEHDGPGPWCDGSGSWSYHDFDCSGGGGGITPGGGSGGGTTGGGVVVLPPTILIPDTPEYQNFYDNVLNTQQKSFWNDPSKADFVMSLISLLINTNYSYETQVFIQWAVNYLMNHPTVSIETFQNQFMGTPEGADGEYDSNYWDDPNLYFPPQDLPTWADFVAAFPSHDDINYDSPYKMYNSIGGSVYTNGYEGSESNTCAIRLSKALNYSGVTIPSIPGSTFKGADNKYYFLGAAKMIVWMKKTFGTTTNPNYSHNTNADGGANGFNFPTVIGSKKGIFGLLPNVAYAPTNNPTLPAFNATGHVDLINNTFPTTNINSVCDGKCYFNATGGVKEINIWTLN